MRKPQPPTNWAKVPEVFDHTYASLVVGFRRKYITQLCRQGRFPAVKHGRKWICTKDQVRAWCEGTWDPEADPIKYRQPVVIWEEVVAP